MSIAQLKTDAIEHRMMDITELEGAEAEVNPNRMNDREFDLLGDNLEQMGVTENVVLWRKPDGQLKIVSGHHRKEAAKLKGVQRLPVAIIVDPDFDEEAYKLQLVRHNVIKGKIDPAGFLKLYEQMSAKYSQEVLQDMFGIADDKLFQQLIGAVKQSLPKDMQSKFVKAAKELKTIDGLAAILNEMFTKYGNTLDHGWMVVDFGGKDSLWVQLTTKRRAAAMVLAEACVQHGRTMDDLLGYVLERAASDPQLIAQAVAAGKPVKMTGQFWPTQQTVVKS